VHSGGMLARGGASHATGRVGAPRQASAKGAGRNPRPRSAARRDGIAKTSHAIISRNAPSRVSLDKTSPAKGKRSQIVCHAAQLDAGASSDGVNWKLVFYFVLWYAFNIIFNILNKSTLNIFPKPWLLSTIQLGAGVLWMMGMWVLRLQPVPRITPRLLRVLAPIALFHVVAHVSACVSFSKMAVSFTHVIKASEPVFTVLVSSIFMGKSFSGMTYLSLVPIVCGCSLAAMKEISFAWGGLSGALISNLGTVLRSICSKQLMDEFKEIDGINTYALISAIGLVYLAPVAYLVEGATWSAGWASAVQASGSAAKFIQLLAAGGVFYHLYNQVSFQALTGISPLTFSVGNTMKRIAVITSSILFFKNFVSPLNWVGTALAIFGAYMYSNSRVPAKKEA